MSQTSQPIHLLRLIRSLNPEGGGPIDGILQSTPYLSSQGITTTVASLDPPNSHFLSNLPFQSIPLGPVLGSYGYHPRLLSKLRSYSSSFDVVIIEGLWTYISLVASRVFLPLHIPYFVYTHGMLDPWFKRAYPFKHFRKSLYWPFAEYNLLREASGVLFTTHAECILARHSFSRYSAREYVVGYGSSACPDPSQINYNIYYNRFPELIGKEIYLFLGRIHPKKGLDLLINAFSQISAHNLNRHLVLAGPVSSGYRRHLDLLTRSVSIESQITWTGHLDGNLKWAAYSTSSLFCLPSHQENFGVSVAEALSASLPVAISTSVNIADLVQASGSGFVRQDTLLGTVDALQSWVDLDTDQRLSMSQRAYSLFLSEFQWSKASDRLARLLRDPESLPYTHS